LSDAGRSDPEQSRIMMGLLDALERDQPKSQRGLAAELGIALGLVNTYLKRCINKGLVKVHEAPARRYAYYLTPLGFAEKSRLTMEYLSFSFNFFRMAKSECSSLLRGAAHAGRRRIVCAGRSELAEIAAICAADHDVVIVGIVDAKAAGERFAGLPVWADFDAADAFDAVLVTDLRSAQGTAEAAVAELGEARVLIPALLRVRLRRLNGFDA
jgi:DNA-binding MarR family transcriptional regulator